MGGIGTRRWAKFAKYLADMGHRVFVLTSYYPLVDKVNWLYDIEHENIAVSYFKSRYPFWLMSHSEYNFLNKFKRVVNFVLHKTFFYIDNCQYDSNQILKNAKELINKNNIQNVIATGHPVSINYICTYLKIDMPNINLIQDYRDNWNDLNVYQYGNKDGLSFFRQKEKIAYQEFFTLYYSDYIINVSKDLTQNIALKHKCLKDKFITITNGYDLDDFAKIEECKTEEKIKMIYAGSLYNKRIEAIELLMDALLESNDTFLEDRFKLIIYSNYDKSRIKPKYKGLINKNVYFYDFIPPEDILKEIANCRYALSINSKFAPYAFGTKIFDYMALNKKIVHISNGGALYNLLESKNQFVSDYDIKSIKQILRNVKKDFLNDGSMSRVDYSEFSIDKLATRLNDLFV